MDAVTSTETNSPPSPAVVDSESDAVREAEAMADAHLARQDEVERLAKLVRWLDGLVRVPGTKLEFGLDSILGLLLPGVGDALTGAVGLTVVVAAVRRGVPTIVIARMLMNLGIDTALGMVPVAGDVFDLMWKANRRNLELLERHQDELEPRGRAADYAIVGVATTLVLATVAVPFVLLGLLLGALF